MVDCKKPTPYCKAGLVVELMPMATPMVEVWAVDLNDNSFDNCPGDLTYSFSADVDDTGITFNCNHEGQNSVEIWVTDAAGNQDFCVTNVTIQANMADCANSPLVATITGGISTEEGEGVEDVDVQLNGSTQTSVMTNADGSYSFQVATGEDYTVSPVKDDDHLNGVTTYDLVIITKHILGVDPLDSPYKMIAADANNSGTVTTFDLVQLRKLILYINTEFPSNQSWRFVGKDYVFPNTLNPWQEVFSEVDNFNNVALGTLTSDFVGVKIGDVNSSATTNFAGAGEDRTTNGTLVFNVEDLLLEKGETYVIDFNANDFNVQGFQFTMNFDDEKLQFVDVEKAIAKNENFGLTLLEEGVIIASWNDNEAQIGANQPVFKLVFTAQQTVQLSQAIQINGRYTEAEAYDLDGGLLDVALEFNNTLETANFELLQNTPNPFQKETTIGFHLSSASFTTLTITDVSGKTIKVIEDDFEKGYNEILLSRKEFRSSGILYYQLETATHYDTKMMMLLD